MPMRRYKLDQIALLLRQIEAEMVSVKITQQVFRDAPLTAQTFYR